MTFRSSRVSLGRRTDPRSRVISGSRDHGGTWGANEENDEEGVSLRLSSEPALALDPRRGRGRFARIGVERWPLGPTGHVEHLPITARWATEEEHAEAVLVTVVDTARLARAVTTGSYYP